MVPDGGPEVLGKARRARPPLAPLFGGPGGEVGAGAATNGPGDAGREEEEEEEEYRLLTATLSKLKHSLGRWHTGRSLGVGLSSWYQHHWVAGHPI